MEGHLNFYLVVFSQQEAINKYRKKNYNNYLWNNNARTIITGFLNINHVIGKTVPKDVENASCEHMLQHLRIIK